MANGTTKKGIVKISKAINIPAKPEDKSFIDTTITFSDIPSGSYPISAVMHPENSNLNYILPYSTTNGTAGCYVYNWNSSSKAMVIRNIGVAWDNYVLEAVFLIP